MLSNNVITKIFLKKENALVNSVLVNHIVLNDFLTKWVYLKDNSLCIDHSLSVQLFL